VGADHIGLVTSYRAKRERRKSRLPGVVLEKVIISGVRPPPLPTRANQVSDDVGVHGSVPALDVGVVSREDAEREWSGYKVG
jgi:hypothetical protein